MINERNQLEIIHLDKKNSIAHLKCLIILSYADGNMNEDAMGLITERMDRQGLTITDFNLANAELLKEGLLQSPMDMFDKIPFITTSNLSIAVKCLQDYVSLMACDGIIRANEKTVAYAIATKMGLSQSMVDLAIKIHLKQGNEGLKVDETSINVEEMLTRAAAREAEERLRLKELKASEKEQLLQSNADKGKLTGWLILFLLCTAMGGVFSVFYNLYYTDFTQDYKGFGWFFAADFLMYLGHAGICMYVVDGFYKRRNNAVFWAKVTLFSYLLSNCIMLFVNDFPSKWVTSIWGCIYAIVWGGIWYAYLNQSKQVARLIPYEKRAPSNNDWAVVAVIASIPILCCCAGIITIKTEPDPVGEKPNIVQVEPNVYELRHCSVVFSDQYSTKLHTTSDNDYVIGFDCPNGNWGFLYEFDCFPYVDINECLDNEEIPIVFQLSNTAQSSLESAGVDISSFVLKSSRKTDVLGSEVASSYVLRGTGKGSSPLMYVVVAAKLVGNRNYLLVVYYSMHPIEGPSGQRWEITSLLNSIKPK